MNINNLFGQNPPPQQPQNYPPQYQQPWQWQYPPYRQPLIVQNPQRGQKGKPKPKPKPIFRITKMEAYAVGLVLLVFAWKYLSVQAATAQITPKTETKKAILYKGRPQ